MNYLWRCIVKRKSLIAGLCLLVAGALSAQTMENPDASLTEAALAGDVAGMKAALDKGASPDAQKMRLTALTICAVNGFGAGVELLIQHKADVNKPMMRQRTALHYAATKGLTESVRFLLAHGANADACDSEMMGTALYHALDSRRLETAMAILDYPQQLNYVTDPYWSKTPLTLAIEIGDGALVAKLLAKGASPVFHDALAKARASGKKEIVELLEQQSQSVGVRP